MDQIETHMTNVPEISERRKLSTSNEEEKVQKNKIRTFQSNLAKHKYLLDFKRWPIFDFLKPEFILQIHMAMILNDGILIATRDKMVYAFGHNKNKLLGIGCTSRTLQPKKVEVLCGKNIKKFVFCDNGLRILALTKEGEVYSWGYDEEELDQANSCDDHVRIGLTIPTQMSLLRGKHIIDIKCSATHCLALTDDGKVYFWRYLDLNDINKIKPETYLSIDIKQVHFNKKKIVCIACGWSFSMAVSNDGKVYSWSHDIDAGIWLEIDITLLECDHNLNTYQVTSLSNKIIVKVICGDSHMVALTNKGKLYTWGSNSHGQLGLGQKVLSSMYPVLLDMPKMNKVLDIAIGQEYERNIALCNDGCIYMWGGMRSAGLYFNRYLWYPTITPALNMHEALMLNHLPLMIFADDLKYMDEELDVLECWETLFDDLSTSDLTIQVEGQSIHVHKTILRSRSSHFRTMFQDNSMENQSVIQHSQYSYIVYKAFLKYLYTDVIDLSIERLPELLNLAIVYCESKLERYCNQEIKRGIRITIQNVYRSRLVCSHTMNQIETHKTDIPETCQRKKSATSSEGEEVQSDKTKQLQNNLTENKYLFNFKKWRAFFLLEEAFLLRIELAMIYGDGALIVTRDNMVYALGSNYNNRLGIAEEESLIEPRKVEILCDKSIKKFAHGFYMFALTKNGEVYFWDYDEEPALRCNSKTERIDTPTQLIKLREKCIIDIACGDEYFLALTDDGKVYVWGHSDINVINDNIDPETYLSTDIQQVHFNEENKIVCIACGWMFNMAVTDTGKIYSWGYNSNGVLGLNVPPDMMSTPQEITKLSNVVIVKAVCGFAHALALSNEGQLYVWGKDQLITDQKTTDVYYPVLLSIPQIKKVLDIAAVYHSDRSVVLGDDGNVYIWGDYFEHQIMFPIVTYFSNMQEALMYNITGKYPMILFMDDLGYINVESDILKCSQTLFDNPSTSDLTIVVEEKSIYVHKAILKKRSSYFAAMFRHDWSENGQSVIEQSEYSCIVYKTFLKYLYTGEINLPMQKLIELLDLAIMYCETKLERCCIHEIKQGITLEYVVPLYSIAIKHNNKDLQNFCIEFIQFSITRHL